MRLSKSMHFMIFGLTSWDSFPQREHGLARELAAQGHEVDVIELPPSVAGKIHGVFQRLFTPLARDRGFIRSGNPANLRVHIPPIMPTGLRNTLTPEVDRVLFRRWFSKAFSAIDMHSTVGIIMMPLWWGRFLERDVFDPAILVYDIADALEVQSRSQRTLSRLRDCEHLLSREADLVTYSAQEMFREVEILFPGVASLFLPNAVSRSFVEQCAARNGAQGSERKEIGYIGSTYGKWFDADLLLDVIRSFPDSNVSVVGPVDKHLAARCAQYQNVRLHGFVPHEQLPEHLHRFDIAIIPFRQNGITRIVNPLKLYEYASAGLPIVATYTDELRNYAPLVTLARNSEDFIRSITAAMESEPGDVREKRRGFALANTWTERVHRLIAVLKRQAADN
jgi:glycosyltransferase involved in cell wall biosynthesis